jgi:hypothetical protein
MKPFAGDDTLSHVTLQVIFRAMLMTIEFPAMDSLVVQNSAVAKHLMHSPLVDTTAKKGNCLGGLVISAGFFCALP